MVEDRAKLAALVGSRLCHDLISPVGAIQNGLELMGLAGSGPHEAELSLIQQSCDNASARIRFFRVAFGAASQTQLVGQRDILKLLDDINENGRISTVWQPAGDLSRSDVQLAFLGFLCCESALPQGGTVRFDHAAEGWTITATGPRFKVEEDLWAHFDTVMPLGDVTPGRVQFALLSVLARDAGRAIRTRVDDTQVALSIAAA